jgi:toluene monooxygenase system protein B
MDEVAKAAAHHSVGRRVKDQPSKTLRVRRAGESFFARNMKVSESGLKPTECVEIIWE